MSAIRLFLSVVVIAWSMQFLRAADASAYTPSNSTDQWATAEHLTLSAALITAVGILWRELGRKDSLLIASTATVTQALATASASNMELRHILEQSVAAKSELSQSNGLLTERLERLPCTEGLVHK